MRILVVDDLKETTDSLAQLLTIDGHTCQVAYNATDAFRLALVFHPDVVILDLVLPDRHGYDIGKEMQALGCKVIIASGHASSQHIEESKNNGFDYHIVKPYLYSDLRKAIQEVAST